MPNDPQNLNAPHLPQKSIFDLDLGLLSPNESPFFSLELRSKQTNLKLDEKYQKLQN